METGVMSESLVVASDVHQTVTEVLGQLVLDDFKQTDITVKLLLVLDVLDMKLYLFCLPQHRHLLPFFPLPPHFMCSNK